MLVFLWRSRDEEGWRSGESTRLPLFFPGSIPRPGVTCWLSLLLVDCAQKFFSFFFTPGSPVFFPPYIQHAKLQLGFDASTVHIITRFFSSSVGKHLHLHFILSSQQGKSLLFMQKTDSSLRQQKGEVYLIVIFRDSRAIFMWTYVPLLRYV